MSIFDIFKIGRIKQKAEDLKQKIPGKQIFSLMSNGAEQVKDDTAYYKNGILFKILPSSRVDLYEDRHRSYSARYIVSDGNTYDMDDSLSISSIVVPVFADINGMPKTSFDMSYNFQVRLKKEERPNIAVSLAYKTADCMISSPIYWSKKDYYRVVIQLWSIGKIQEADNLLEYIKSKCPRVKADDEYKYIRKESFEYHFRLARELKLDYLISDSCSCCPKCTPYRNRVYSISGKDKRFPKFSDYIPHPEDLCCLSFSGFYYYDGCTITEYNYDSNGNIKEKEIDVIKHSNRLFKDDRSQYQKKMFEEDVIRKEKKAKSDKRYYNRQTWIDKYNKSIKAKMDSSKME